MMIETIVLVGEDPTSGFAPSRERSERLTASHRSAENGRWNRKRPFTAPGNPFFKRNLALSCFNKMNQLFDIIKIIIITNNTFTMIYNPVLFISFQTL